MKQYHVCDIVYHTTLNQGFLLNRYDFYKFLWVIFIVFEVCSSIFKTVAIVNLYTIYDVLIFTPQKFYAFRYKFLDCNCYLLVLSFEGIRNK